MYTSDVLVKCVKPLRDLKPSYTPPLQTQQTAAQPQPSVAGVFFVLRGVFPHHCRQVTALCGNCWVSLHKKAKSVTLVKFMLTSCDVLFRFFFYLSVFLYIFCPSLQMRETWMISIHLAWYLFSLCFLLREPRSGLIFHLKAPLAASPRGRASLIQKQTVSSVWMFSNS